MGIADGGSLGDTRNLGSVISFNFYLYFWSISYSACIYFHWVFLSIKSCVFLILKPLLSFSPRRPGMVACGYGLWTRVVRVGVGSGAGGYRKRERPRYQGGTRGGGILGRIFEGGGGVRFSERKGGNRNGSQGPRRAIRTRPGRVPIIYYVMETRKGRQTNARIVGFSRVQSATAPGGRVERGGGPCIRREIGGPLETERERKKERLSQVRARKKWDSEKRETSRRADLTSALLFLAPAPPAPSSSGRSRLARFWRKVDG